MNILQINKFFNIHGGSEAVLFETIKGLKEQNETVAEFSMRDRRNAPSDYSTHFVSAVSLKNNRAEALIRIFYSSEVKRKLNELIDEVKPDVAHLHNVYRELSASTFLTLKKRGVPMVLTVHDMFPLIPNHSFMHGETLAEELYRKPFNWIRYSCVNGSLAQSIVGTVESYYYRLRGIWEAIDVFICPSEFMKNKMAEYGFPVKKLVVIKNPCELPTTTPALGTKIVYFGRLHVEKGIRVFMRSLLEGEMKSLPVLIVGDGPEKEWVDNFIHEQSLTNVERREWVRAEKIPEIMAEAKVVVVPSVFYETGGLSAIEALSYGRVVVASDRGALPEVVKDGETGFLVKPEDSKALSEGIQRAISLNADEVERITKAGRGLIEREYDPEKYINELVAVYKTVLN